MVAIAHPFEHQHFAADDFSAGGCKGIVRKARAGAGAALDRDPVALGHILPDRFGRRGDAGYEAYTVIAWGWMVSRGMDTRCVSDLYPQLAAGHQPSPGSLNRWWSGSLRKQRPGQGGARLELVVPDLERRRPTL